MLHRLFNMKFAYSITLGRRNLLISESSVVACADSSSLVAEVSCAVAEFD